MQSNKIVAYYYDQEVGNYNDVNLMRPHRVRLAHNLIDGYGLQDKMLVHRPVRTPVQEMEQFHADEYIEFLSLVTPEAQSEYLEQMRRFNMGPAGEADCPVFDGMFEYFQIYTGGSVGGAAILNDGSAEIAVNWSGGAHHAKKAEASGFCYINDIVLAVLELLKNHQRVLYVDIDIHHGDGVEEAFLDTDRVMTVSFHKYGDFFPGTGALDDVGNSAGKYYSVNVPLQEGMDDESYRYVYEPIMAKVMQLYQPGAVVVCSGADSLAGDRLGCFNLSLEGHSHCIEFLAKYGLPLLVVGGGGYTMRNVSRCWCYETGRLLGMELPDDLPLPALDNTDYWLDTHKLRIMVSNMKNSNSRAKLEAIRNQVLENLAALEAAPSAPFTERPPSHKLPDAPEEDIDVRGGGAAADDRRIVKDEQYDSDHEADSRGDVAWGATAVAEGAADEGAVTAADSRAAGPKVPAAEGDADSGGLVLPSAAVARDTAAEPQGGNVGGQIAPSGGIMGADDSMPAGAGEYRQKSPESAAQPMLVDGTVLREGQAVSAQHVQRASDLAAREEEQRSTDPQDHAMPDAP